MGRSLVFGMGVNDLKTHNGCPFYDRWKGMLRRCYRPAKRDAARYSGCKVSNEWLAFSAFKDWMEARPWRGNCLDKDILRPGEKMYSPDTCVFIPNWLNTLMNDGAANGCSLPLGVYLYKGHYVARVHSGTGERIYVGRFDDAESAYKAWAHAKAQVIRSAIDRYRLTDRYDERICDALSKKAFDLHAASHPKEGEPDERQALDAARPDPDSPAAHP